MTTKIIYEPTAALASKFINNTHCNVFLTGKAGTGKTTFLKHIIKTTYKKAIIVAPTGVAAINAGGVTMHSLFQLPFGAYIPTKEDLNEFYGNFKINNQNTLLKNLHLKDRKRKLLQELELLIIDEVSMLRADLLDAIDAMLKSVRKKHHLVFGGIQVLFIGDLLQLPPVIKEEEWIVLEKYYNSMYFFNAHALQHTTLIHIELEKVYRQTDNTFIAILNNLRNNEVSQENIELLNQHYKPNYTPTPKDNYILLTTHNYSADNINRQALQQLKNLSYYFHAEIKDEFNENAYPVEKILEIKKGAQIMFIKNDPTGKQRFFNGKIGIISKINDEEIEVNLDEEGTTISIEKYVWQNIKYDFNETTNEIEETVIGTFTQYPIKLAWAITVHKSQGLTFSKAIIDVGRAFTHGQVYVALSRLTSLEGLILSSPINYNSLNIDNTIIAFSKTKDDIETLLREYEVESQDYFKNYILQCFDFKELENRIKEHNRSYTKDKSVSVKQKYYTWAKQLLNEFEQLQPNTESFTNQIQQIIENKRIGYKQHLYSRIQAAKDYFTPLLKEFSKNVLQHIEEVKKEKKAKSYINELLTLEASFFKQIQMIHKAESFVKATIDHNEFNIENINTKEENEKRIAEIGTCINPSKQNKGRKKEVSTPKKQTKEESYNFYMKGKSIQQIAEERELTVTTIEGHLSHYVSLGMLNINDFVEKKKMEAIIAVAKEFDTIQQVEIKKIMGDEYSYSDIRFAMAYYQNANKEVLNQ